MSLLYKSLSSALVLFAVLHFQSAAGQNCYYPNGDLSTGDGACSSDGGACCPFNWECLSNGLCYLENAGYFGRYTCTDRTWQSGSCSQFCTQGNTAIGDEAVLQCDDGSWCCDGDRSFDCCSTEDTSYFELPQGIQIAFISTVSSASPVRPLATANSVASTIGKSSGCWH